MKERLRSGGKKGQKGNCDEDWRLRQRQGWCVQNSL
jgi:hypothetical protein